ncbi:MAG: ribose-phosphate pyrophosphokinase-like domain-containing protein [Gemmata sp.]
MPPALKVISRSAHFGLAGQIARELGEQVTGVEIGAFADGEGRVQIADDLRGAHDVIVQPAGPAVNDIQMVVALLTDAAKAAGAVAATAVVPYFGCARQDRRDHVGEPRSAQVAGGYSPLWESLTSSSLTSTGRRSRAHCRCRPSSLAPTSFCSRGSQPGDFRTWSSCLQAGGLNRAQRFAAAMNAPPAGGDRQKPPVAGRSGGSASTRRR